MLNKEELAAFLALLLEFVTTNGLSTRNIAALFGISHPTAARWMILTRSQSPESTYIYRHLAMPIKVKIEKLNYINETRGIYAALDGYPKPAKVEMLQGALLGRIV